jgi:hypothetical protein
MPIMGSLARIIVLGSMLCVATLAYAVDEDLPPPEAGDTQVPRRSSVISPSTSTAVQTEDETLPSPSLGDESLPEPSADRGQENARNQVNRPPDDDDIFLPTPNVNDNIYYAPVGTPAPRMSAEDVDWRVVTQNRPAFTLLAGIANKGYINNQVKGRITGPTAGASYRVISLGQTVFIHAQVQFAWFTVGDVLSVANVKDEQMQYGGILEFGIGRRLSLYGSLLRRQSRVSADKLGVQNSDAQNIADLENVGSKPEFKLGAGGQWDFYVQPHGSLGARLHLEPDLFMITLAVSMEPEPRKKLSLNFDRPRD